VPDRKFAHCQDPLLGFKSCGVRFRCPNSRTLSLIFDRLMPGRSKDPSTISRTLGHCAGSDFFRMKNLRPRDVPVVRDLPPNLMREIGRVIFFHSYVEWRLGLIIHDILHVTRVLSRLVPRDPNAIDRFDLICDLVSLKEVKTGVDLIHLRKSLVSAMSQRDSLAHGTWVRDPQTKAFLLRIVRGSWKPIEAKKLKTKRSTKTRPPKYGIDECRSLNQLINGIILTVDELYSDTLGQPALSRQKLH